MRVILPKLLSNDLTPRSISVLASVLLILICGAVVDTLVAAHQAEAQRASIDAGNIAAAIAQDIRRNIELYDLSLQGAAEQIDKPEVAHASKELRQAILFDRAATASFLGEIELVDADGNLIESSATLEPQPRNDADRDYFRIHKQIADFGLYISRPLSARGTGQQIMALSRRINKPDGSFGGIVVGTLRLDYMHQLFSQMKLGPNGSLTLFRNDGTIMMREPLDPTIIGSRQPPPILFDMASRSREGEYEGLSVVDGIRRQYHFHRIGALPLVANVGFATADVYSEWWRRTVVIGTLVVGCCALIVLLTLRLGRELRLRIEAEATLRSLVDLDPLTSLANRRCFDRALAAERHRAVRRAASLSLLMIDADHFKPYNDTFGHAAGDEALRRIARCLTGHARRAGDLAARYGGEEFAVILPGVDSADALRVAEDVRQAILDLDLVHVASPLGIMTVSIGCSTLHADTVASVADLIAAADAALYRSKRAGRNSCHWQAAVDDAPPLSLAS